MLTITFLRPHARTEIFSGVVSALCADWFEPPACTMLRRGKQARRYSFGSAARQKQMDLTWNSEGQ
jgi:hypothetical protein